LEYEKQWVGERTTLGWTKAKRNAATMERKGNWQREKQHRHDRMENLGGEREDI